MFHLPAARNCSRLLEQVAPGPAAGDGRRLCPAVRCCSGLLSVLSVRAPGPAAGDGRRSLPTAQCM